MRSYARRDLLRNPRRTLATLAGVMLGVGLFSGVLFFIDGSGASMTKRAIAPVAIDVQRVMTSPLGEGIRLEQQLVESGPMRTGDRARMELTVHNLGAATANEVLINDKLPPELEYVLESARRDGEPIPDESGQSPFAHGPGLIGLNLGAVEPGATVRLAYDVEARRPVAAPADLPVRATIATREDVVPDPANLPRLVPLDQLRDRIAAIPGVAAANQLAFAQVPPGALRSGGVTIDRSVKIFGFDATYAHQYPAIRLVNGDFDADGALLSSEAARALGVRLGDQVELDVPGARQPARLRVSGTVDLSRARTLFNSRTGRKLEDFLYIADSIVLSPQTFDRIVIPAFRDAIAARGNALAVKSPPTLEVDVHIVRAPLNADPGRALEQTQAVTRRIKRIAPEQDFILDNISNTLTVARADAAVAKRMFLFLGLPGLLLAGFLAAYAGTILAASQRREQANLRLRGATPAHLTRLLAYRTVALAGLGSLLGTLAGFATVLAILGPSALLEAAPAELAISALIAIGAGLVATGLALYVPGRRALRREVSGERRELSLELAPTWRRRRLDYVALLIATVAVLIAVRNGAFDAPSGAVSTGIATSLRSHLLVLPLGVWFAGTLLSVRFFESAARHVPSTPPPRFGAVVRGLLGRTLSRRSTALVTGIVGVGLVIAFGIGLAVFAATYDAAKQADARFTVGSDLRVTPSPVSDHPHTAEYARELEVDGVVRSTPVVARLENAFLRSLFNSDVKDLAAIEVDSFAETATLSDEFFPDMTAEEALDALRADPTAILIDVDSAEFLKLEVGDPAELLFARGTKRQQLRRMTVAGFFERFPGFPESLHIVANLDYFRQETGITDVDFYLARTDEPSSEGLAAATAAIQAGPGATDLLNIDTTETTFNKDQSSLTALNIRGLVDLDSIYTLAMCAAVIAIFVFGLMLQRRREYVVLRAQGLPAGRLQLLLLGEAGFVAASGLLAGAAVGAALGVLLVSILKPLFILEPAPTLPFADAVLLATLLATATLVSAVAALVVLRRLSPSEVLREQ
ncbi:MAG TPA: FtsX-like permease family protein [Euzebyales bacterium]|nr:FtsX-like permease family protein [Euzebyales bacterium]